jgi:hypothetical protein
MRPFIADMKFSLANCKKRREELWTKVQQCILMMIVCPADEENLAHLSYYNNTLHTLEQDVQAYIKWILLVQSFIDARQVFHDSLLRIMRYNR